MQTHFTESDNPRCINGWTGYSATAHVWAINDSMYVVTVHGVKQPTIKCFSEQKAAIQYAKEACGVECFPIK